MQQLCGMNFVHMAGSRQNLSGVRTLSL